jgi:pimeloyl-ACP methyl ester carboxylesterase
MRSPVLGSLATGLLALAACSVEPEVRAVDVAAASDEPSGDEPSGDEPSGPDYSIDWDGDAGGVQTGTINVPFDYADPSTGSFELFVARRPADGRRIGTLLVNPGGPGFGGSDFALHAEQIYGDDLLEHFDIVGWDPRGTGKSTPAIDCFDDYDRLYAGGDPTPDTVAEHDELVALAAEAGEACVAANSEIISHVGTNNSARDIDAIRRALGEDQISYFGFSYGSELGATWATLFPETVRAAVFDGARDPNADNRAHELQQNAGFEATLATFLARCSADDDCPLHNDGDAEGAFDALMTDLDEHPVRANDGRPDLTRRAALTAVSQAMYAPSYWSELEQGLADAQQGDGRRLQDLYDQYFGRRSDGTYGNELEAYLVISCADSAERLTVAEEDAGAAELRRVAPRISPWTVGSYQCTFTPPSEDPRLAVDAAGAGPILVIGTTGDPATPLASSEAMADALEGARLVVVDADQHTGYRANPCSVEVVDDFLVDPLGNAPANGARCD